MPSAASATHPPIGTLIDGGSLELVEVLGVGGYGVVYRALDIRSSSPKSYAVKCLVHADGGQQTARRQLRLKEIRLHQHASSHPGVVTLHRVIEEYNRTYLIMDYAPDHDLFTQILNNCRYLGDDGLIKHVFLQLLDAVEFCHSSGVYHRDLKPENVLCFDGGFRVAITDFGLATTDGLSEEFRTGSIFHMSPECHGGDFVGNGPYSPMFNDVWSLGIILLNLATGRNPWKSATPDDATFQAYLRKPMSFLPTVLPISYEINDILIRALDVDWRQRMTIPELREAIEEVSSFYSDDVVFEGNMAKCPWELMNETPSAKETSTVAPTSPVTTDLQSHWSKDSRADPTFVGKPPSPQASWEGRSSGATWASDSASSSDSRDGRHIYDRSQTPASPASSGASLPSTPNSIFTTFAGNAKARKQKLTLDTNLNDLHFPANRSTRMASYSPGSSMMQTAVEFGYSSSFFLSSPASDSHESIPMSHFDEREDSFAPQDKEMASPSDWAQSATSMTFPSAYSSDGGSVDSCEMAFARSGTPSPDSIFWPEYQTHPHPRNSRKQETSQLSSSVSLTMTDALSPSRPDASPALSTAAAADSESQGSTPKAPRSKFNPIKFFPRPSAPSPVSSQDPPSSPPPSPYAQRWHGPPESFSNYVHHQVPPQAPVPTWVVFSAPSAPRPIPIPAQADHRRQSRRAGHLRSPRDWFLPRKFFASAGVS